MTGYIVVVVVVVVVGVVVVVVVIVFIVLLSSPLPSFLSFLKPLFNRILTTHQYTHIFIHLNSLFTLFSTSSTTRIFDERNEKRKINYFFNDIMNNVTIIISRKHYFIFV